MKYRCTFVSVAVLVATMLLSGVRALGQQEVDPTSYPLTPAVVRSSHRPVIRTVNQASGHDRQTAKRRPTPPVAGPAHHDAAKTVAKR